MLVLRDTHSAPRGFAASFEVLMAGEKARGMSLSQILVFLSDSVVAAFAKHAAGRDETWQESLAKTVGEAVAHPQPADDGPPPGGAA